MWSRVPQSNSLFGWFLQGKVKDHEFSMYFSEKVPQACLRCLQLFSCLAVPSLNDLTLNPHDNPIRVVDNPLNIPFPEVQTFDDILPLSSTPLSSIHRQSARLSSVRPRGLLPLEIEESPVPHLSGSRIQAALSRRSDQVRKLLSKSKSDSSSS